jgi:hypothetical protein
MAGVNRSRHFGQEFPGNLFRSLRKKRFSRKIRNGATKLKSATNDILDRALRLNP